MKKQVQIVTIPYNGKSDLLQVTTDAMEYRGRCKGDIELHDSPHSQSDYFQPVQLLVLSDDEIQEGDKAKSSYLDNVTHIVDREWIDYMNAPKDIQGSFKKVIASYPQIGGTLPISKETISTHIKYDKAEKEFIVVDDLDCQIVITCDCFFDDNEAIQYNVDPAGNLVLNLDFKVEEVKMPVDDPIEQMGKHIEELPAGGTVELIVKSENLELYKIISDPDLEIFKERYGGSTISIYKLANDLLDRIEDLEKKVELLMSKKD